MCNLEVSIVTVQTLHLGAGGGGPLVQLRAVLRLDAVHAPRPLLEVQPGTGEPAKLPAVLHTVETAAAVLLVVSEGHNPEIRYLRFHCIHISLKITLVSLKRGFHSLAVRVSWY